MTNKGSYHGGLVFYGYPENPLDQFSRIVSSTLEDYGHPVEHHSVREGLSGHVLTSQYRVELSLETPDHPGLDQGDLAYEDQSQRLVVTFNPVSPGHEDRDITELMLAVLLYRMADTFDVDQIEWLDSDMVLTVEDFLSAFSRVSPRRVRGRQELLDRRGQRFAPVDETAPELMIHYDAILGNTPHAGKIGLIDLSEEERLALAFRETPRPDELDPEAEEPASDIRRLATWGLTGMLAFLSTPVAASVAAVNLIRGEDLRLNTHVLSLTGLLVMLQSSGALASAVNYLP